MLFASRLSPGRRGAKSQSHSTQTESTIREIIQQSVAASTRPQIVEGLWDEHGFKRREDARLAAAAGRSEPKPGPLPSINASQGLGRSHCTLLIEAVLMMTTPVRLSAPIKGFHSNDI